MKLVVPDIGHVASTQHLYSPCLYSARATARATSHVENGTLSPSHLIRDARGVPLEPGPYPKSDNAHSHLSYHGTRPPRLLIAKCEDGETRFGPMCKDRQEGSSYLGEQS